jgi:hypothetical protein
MPAKGGDSPYGGGGGGTPLNAAGASATGYGAGGSGASSYSSSTTFAGGAGAPGIVVITEYGLTSLGSSTAASGAVRYDLPQGLTGTQQAQGRANIGVLKKNYIINGAMMVSQENGTTAGTITGYYPVDQWVSLISLSGGAVKFEQTNSASTPPGRLSAAGSPNRLRTTVTAAQATIGSSYVILTQKIEGLRTTDLLLGTAAAKTVTVQLGVNAPAGTYAVTLYNPSQSNAGGGTFTIAAGEAGTDVVKTVVVSSGMAAGTWPIDNTAGMLVWVTLAATGQANLLATNGAVFELFDVSLTEGTVVPPFVVPDYASELAACQRYYQLLDVPISGLNIGLSAGASSVMWNFAEFMTEMRSAPTSALKVSGSLNNATVSVGGATIRAIRVDVTAVAAGAFYAAGMTISANARL